MQTLDQHNGNGTPSPGVAPGRPAAGGGLRRFVKPAPPPADAPADVLARFQASQKPKPQPGEACELCATPVPEEHPHCVNIETRELMCVCRPCYLLFTKPGAALGKFRPVPDRYIFDPMFALDNAQWEAIQIPVSMAFLFYNSQAESFVAFYPSPAGATESLLDLEAWREVMAANTSFQGILPDVEALLIKQEDERFTAYLVPIDKAYELTAIVRMNWRGFSGGEEVWGKIEGFFAALRDRSLLIGPGPRNAASSGQGPDEGTGG